MAESRRIMKHVPKARQLDGAMPENNRGPKPVNLTKVSIEKIAGEFARSLKFRPYEDEDILRVVGDLGGQVLVKDFWDIAVADEGSIVVRTQNDFEIYVPSHTSFERDRFTIAHELGHYVLHYLWSEFSPRGRFVAQRYGSDRTEWEANWFAAGLLMPTNTFTKKFHEFTSDLYRVSDYFCVSLAAAQVRARSLGLLNGREKTQVKLTT